MNSRCVYKKILIVLLTFFAFKARYIQTRDKLHARSRKFKQTVFENSVLLKAAESNPETRSAIGVVQPVKDMVREI